MRVPHALRINSGEGSHKGDSREMSVWLHMPLGSPGSNAIQAKDGSERRRAND